MPWNGAAPNQSFGRTDGISTGDTTWQQAAAAPRNIVAGDHDTHDTDIKDGINACLKKDGGNTAAANIPMGGFTLTNIANASARTSPASFAQLQDNKGEYVATVGGTADAITLTPSPAITAYAAGQRFSFIAGGTNTGATTVNVSGVGAQSIKRNDGSATALAAGDIVSASLVDIEYNGTNFLLLSALPLDADLTAIAALNTTGILRRSGSNTWALDAGVTHLAATTADRLFGTNGAGASGLITVGNGVQVASGAVALNVNGLTEDITPDETADFVATFDASASGHKKVKLQNITQSGGLQLLNSGTVSAATTLDIVLTSFTAYRGLQFILTNFVPATDDVELWMQVSTDGGSTYDAGAGNYRYVNFVSNESGAGAQSSAADTKIRIAGDTSVTGSISNTAAEGGCNVIIDLLNQVSTAIWPRIMLKSAWLSAAGQANNATGHGQRVTAQDTDAVRFLFETGNIASGSWALYGYA